MVNVRRLRLFWLSALVLAAALASDAAAAKVRPSREEPFMLRAFPPVDTGGHSYNAICYGPHRDGQRPGGPEPSAAQLREDLRLLAGHWRLVRIYGSVGFADTFLSVIRADGFEMQVVLGVWIAVDDPDSNRAEIEGAVRLAATYPEVVAAVCVGNETQVSWSDHRCPPEFLIAALREMRARVAVPVTTADDFNFWNKPESRAVAAEIDFITLHAHPLWNGRQLDEALPWLREQTAAVAALHPDRAVVIGETGWATTRHNEGEQARLMKGRVGETEQKAFHDAVRAWAEAERITVFFFEAFDENWKGGEHSDEVEKHWGLLRTDRTPKAALASGG
jgi:exo-beta-1,3-glucanase (GH17 family)